MIDTRFRLVPTEHKHLQNLHFRVDMPLDKNYKKSDTEAVLVVCKQQYPELVFHCAGDFYTYNARFPDGQYALGIIETTTSTHTNLGYVKSILFSLPLQLDTIMSAVCGFKKAVPPLQYTLYEPAQLIDLTPDDFLEVVENMYQEVGFNLRVRAISWQFKRVRADNTIEYTIQAIDYDYI